LDSYAIDESKIKIFEIENEPDMNEIQSYMAEITGGRTVPRIFVGGQFVGGAEELVSLHYSQRLDQILSSGGAL
jgi:glutaredoxin 3